MPNWCQASYSLRTVAVLFQQIEPFDTIRASVNKMRDMDLRAFDGIKTEVFLQNNGDWTKLDFLPRDSASMVVWIKWSGSFFMAAACFEIFGPTGADRRW